MGNRGVIALYAMWLVHLALFRNAGWANWAGFLIVVQKSSVRCSTPIYSIFWKAGSMCWASVCSAAWC